MTRTRFPIVTGEMCGSWCDVRGPEGRVKLTDYDATGLGRRTSTRFKMSYGNVLAECQGPVTNTGWPFVCGISPAGEAAQQWLEVRPGCLSARLTHTPGTTSEDALELRTDVLKIAGSAVPAREISLLHEREVLVSSDVPGGGVDFYTRPGATLAPATVLALVAYHAFIHLEGTPEECLN